MADRDLIADEQRTPEWTDSMLRTLANTGDVWSHAPGVWLQPLAVELLAARARITELEQVTQYATERAVAAEAIVEGVRAALATHPHCDVHPDDDPVSCGWKRAVADVEHALEAVHD